MVQSQKKKKGNQLLEFKVEATMQSTQQSFPNPRISAVETQYIVACAISIMIRVANVIMIRVANVSKKTYYEVKPGDFEKLKFDYVLYFISHCIKC